MLLSSPALPISIAEADVHLAILRFIASMGYSSLKVTEKKLIYVPFWFAEYDVLSETSEHFSGSKAMNAFLNELDEGIACLLKNRPSALSRELPTEQNLEVIKSHSTSNDAKKSMLFKIAGEYKTPPENVAIIHFSLFFVPFWDVLANVNEKQHTFRINAYNSEISESSGLVVREKNLGELFTETLDELRTPEGWASNSKTILDTASGALAGAGKNLKIWKLSPIDVTIAVLVIALILVLLKVI